MRHFLKTLVIVLLVCLMDSLSAKTIEGRIQTEDNSPAPGAQIALLKVADSTLVKAEVTDIDGYFKLWVTTSDDLIIKVSYPGYADLYLTIEAETKDFGTLKLLPESKLLDEVVITRKQPLVTRDHDKLVLNVENNALTAASTAWDVLSLAPGVLTDLNDQITLKGRPDVQIWINGKQSPLTQTDLANYLKSMSSDLIAKVEVISNPAARYDASGTGGIVNIVLKKDKRYGTNGSLTLTGGMGRYPKSVGSLSLNQRNKRMNFFGLLNTSYRKNFNELNLYRQFYENGSFEGAYDQANYLTIDRRNIFGRVGVDFYLNDKMDLGFVVNGNTTKFNPTGLNKSSIIGADLTKTGGFSTENKSHDHWYDLGGNINYIFRINDKGQELKFDADYAPYGNQTEQNFYTTHFDANDQQIGNLDWLYGDIEGSLGIYAAKLDYVLPVTEKLKLESGGKFSHVFADNDLKFFNRFDQISVFDSTKSNHFLYKENITAAYLNGSYQFEKLMLQAGLRMEHSMITGEQITINQSFDKNYARLFPSALAVLNLDKKNEVSLSVSRRINRPSYGQLNPFKFFLDPTTYKEGNPYLNPEMSWNYELTYTYDRGYSVQLGYSRTQDQIIEIIGPVEGQERVTVQTEKNINHFDYYGVSFILPSTFFKIWQSYNTINAYYGFYSANLINTPLSKGAVTGVLSSRNVISLPSNFNLELTGNIRSREIAGYLNVRPLGFVSFGAQKHFNDKKWSVKASISDIFFTSGARATTTFSNYIEHFDVNRDTRVAALEIVYRFGNATPSGSGARKQGGAEEEKSRASSAAG